MMLLYVSGLPSLAAAVGGLEFTTIISSRKKLEKRLKPEINAHDKN